MALKRMLSGIVAVIALGGIIFVTLHVLTSRDIPFCHRIAVALVLAIGATGVALAGRPYVSINLSTAAISWPGIADVLTESGFDPAEIVIEVTEHEPVADYGALAEGVETAEELTALQTLGAIAAQGYLLARPSTNPTDWASWDRPEWCRLFPVAPPTNCRACDADCRLAGHAAFATAPEVIHRSVFHPQV